MRILGDYYVYVLFRRDGSPFYVGKVGEVVFILTKMRRKPTGIPIHIKTISFVK
jgi:hypothetical protein